MFIRNVAWLVLLIVFSAAGADDTKPRLLFSHKIGLDWPANSPFWMNFVAISADGASVVSNGQTPNGDVRGLGLWAFPDGKFIRAAPGGVLSGDFKLIATARDLLALGSGRRVAPLAEGYRFGAFSPDGKYFACIRDRWLAPERGASISVARTSDGSPVRKFGTRFTTVLAIDADNQTLASGHWDNVTLWNLLSGERIGLLAGFGRYVSGVAFSKDGRLLAAGTDTGYLQIWDVADRRRMHAMRVGYAEVSNPAFSPDSTLVAAGTYGDGTVSLVEVASGAILSQIQVSMFGCGSVAFSPDGRYLVTPSNGGQLRPRRFDSGGSIRVFRVTQ